MNTAVMKRLQINIDEELDDALASRARRTHTSKAALIRDAVRRSIGEPQAPDDPFRDWIGGSEAPPAPVDKVVYGS
jgi:predicted transcriptional regulator